MKHNNSLNRKNSVPLEWIDNIRYNLADIVVKGDWDDFGIFRILNRISFACRYHLMFVIAYRTGEVGDNKRVPIYQASPIISSLDPEFFDLTFDTMRKAGIMAGKYNSEMFHAEPDKQLKLIGEVAENYAIEIWGSGICVITFRLKPSQALPGEKTNLDLEPVSKTSELGSFITEVLKPFDGGADASTHHPNLMWSDRMSMPREAAIQGLGHLRNAGNFKRASNDNPEGKSLTQEVRKIIDGYVSEVEKLIDDEYKNRIKKCPLLTNNLSGNEDGFTPIPNAFFMNKVFDSSEMRHWNYKYNVRCIIPEAQIEEISGALKKAKRDDFISYDDGMIDNEFWANAKSEQGRQEICDALKKPVLPCIRLFVDSVLMSGTTLIKPDVFSRSAIGWVEKQGLDELSYHQALYQLACYHFTLQLGSPVRPVDATQLTLVALPFRCSGGIWMAAIYVRDNPVGPIDDLVDKQRYEENCLIYHSIFKESERKLRRRAKWRYTNALGALVAKSFQETQMRGRGNDLLLCIDNLGRDTFKQGVRALTRVYPFEPVQLVSHLPQEQNVWRFGEFTYKTRENEFFDRLTLHNFVKEDSSIKHLNERVILSTRIQEE